MFKKLISAGVVASMLIAPSALAQTLSITYGERTVPVPLSDSLDITKTVDALQYLVEPFGFKLDYDSEKSSIVVSHGDVAVPTKAEPVASTESKYQVLNTNKTVDKDGYTVTVGSENTFEMNGVQYNLTTELSGIDESGGYHTLAIKLNDATFTSENLDSPYSLTDEIYVVNFKGDTGFYIFNGVLGSSDYVEEYCYRYDGENLAVVDFKDGEGSFDALQIGNTCAFTVSDITDTGFKFYQKTRTAGMWSICRTVNFENNKGTIATEEAYAVNCKTFLKPYATAEEMIADGTIASEEEYNKLLEGFALCHTDYEEFKNGEYFTILKDDNNGMIVIQTEAGTIFKLDVTKMDAAGIRDSISQLVFYLAG